MTDYSGTQVFVQKCDRGDIECELRSISDMPEHRGRGVSDRLERPCG